MRKRAIAALSLVVLGSASLFAWLNVGRWLSPQDERRPVDAVVVLLGDPDRRLQAALDAVRSGLADEVWVTTARAGPVIREREAILDFASRSGLRDAVVVLGESTSLRADANLVLARVGATRPDLAVVSAPYHLARAELTFRRTLAYDVAVWSDGSPYDADRWWTSEPETTILEAAKLVVSFVALSADPTGGAGSVPFRMPLAALGGGFVTAVVAGLAMMRVGRRLGMVAVPRLWRAQEHPVPMLGGVAIVAGIVVGVLVAGGVNLGSAGIVATAGVVGLGIVGLIDDVAGLGPWTRIVWSAVAGVAAWVFGIRADVFAAGLPAELADAAVTVFWFVGITHALNVLDNLDGAAGGVAAASAATIAVVASIGGQFVVAVAAAALAGACLGYLVHNRHPARLFMGDLGALAMGFALASLAMGLRPDHAPPLSFAVPVLALGVAIFDTALVTVSRLHAGRRVALGATDHTAHRLIVRGRSVREAAAILWLAQLVLGAAAVAVATTGQGAGWTVVALVAVAGVAVLVLFLRTPPWTPDRQREASEGVLDAIERAIWPLRTLEERAGRNGFADADPTTARSIKDTLRRLEAVRRELLGGSGE